MNLMEKCRHGKYPEEDCLECAKDFMRQAAPKVELPKCVQCGEPFVQPTTTGCASHLASEGKSIHEVDVEKLLGEFVGALTRAGHDVRLQHGLQGGLLIWVAP